MQVAWQWWQRPKRTRKILAEREIGGGIDLLFVDQMMAHKACEELIEFVDSNHRYAQTKCIMVGDRDVYLRAAEKSTMTEELVFLSNPGLKESVFNAILKALPRPAGIELSNLIDTHDLQTRMPVAWPGIDDKLSARILLVEDNLVNQKVAMSILLKAGLHVEIAENGLEAVSKFQASKFDLILMDCQMPELDGYEATQCIRELDADKPIPIVALTANAMENDRRRCEDAGMDDYIAKPFTPDQLINTIRRWISSGNSETNDVQRSNSSASSISIDSKKRISLLDLRVIANMREMIGEEDFQALIPEYIKSATTILAGLADAAAAGDVQTTLRLAHSLKSSSANLGAMSLSNMARLLEQQLSGGEEPIGAEQINELNREFDRVSIALQNLQ